MHRIILIWNQTDVEKFTKNTNQERTKNTYKHYRTVFDSISNASWPTKQARENQHLGKEQPKC